MTNKDCLGFWEELSKREITQESVKVNKINNHYREDSEFILKFATKDSKILDLAVGSGGALNLYYDKVGFVVAVEKFKEFSNLIVQAENVLVVNEDLNQVDIKKLAGRGEFDIILLFGVMQYFGEKEGREIYKKCRESLRNGAKLIIKQQFGVQDDVCIEFSEELQTSYVATYRHLKKEKQILKECGFLKIVEYDIYPQEANRFENTHFYALVCE